MNNPALDTRDENDISIVNQIIYDINKKGKECDEIKKEIKKLEKEIKILKDERIFLLHEIDLNKNISNNTAGRKESTNMNNPVGDRNNNKQLCWIK